MSEQGTNPTRLPGPRGKVTRQSGSSSLRQWWLLAPAAGVYTLFLVVPFFQTVHLSLWRSTPLGEPGEWAGLDNFRRTLTDPAFRQALLNNATYGLITLFSEVGVGLVLAVLIQRSGPWRGAYRVAIATPLLIALVASAILWRTLLRYDGLLNAVLAALGWLSEPQDWLNERRLVYVVGLMSGWIYCGFYMLLFDAALARVSPELREAARLDGADGWRVFWHVERPLLRPVMAVAVLLCVTGAFRVFDLFYVMVGPSRVPAAEVASTLVVKTAFKYHQFGEGAAMAVVVAVLLATLSAMMLKLTARAREIEF